VKSKRWFFLGGATLAVAFIASGATMAGRAVQAAPSAAEATQTLVERVKQVTRSFQDVRRAGLAGYGPFLGCVSGPEHGAMGTHYVNPQYVGDGELDVNRPEALIYETRDGSPQLVGVEYLVIAEQWHKTHAEPPVFEGQTLHYSGSPNRYGLPPFYEIHVWAWRENPQGAFADWNTHVSCEGQ
jgi:hypothetical protein